MKQLLIIGTLAAAIVAAGSASADTIATSTFTTGDDGWSNGDLDHLGSTTPVTYDAATGTITVADNYGSNGFVAPIAYLGNQSAAFGGTITFDEAEASTDGVNYAPLSLISGATVLYAQPAPPPGTSLTSYSISLVGSSFYTGDPFNSAGGAAVTDATLQAVLASLDRLAVQADWHSGGDFAQLDNVVLSSADAAPPAVPEPATWAMMVGGFGLVGAGMRRRTARMVQAI